MFNKRLTIFVLLILLGVSFPLYSKFYDNTGTTAGNFLKIGIGARMIGMAEAYTAVADDANALNGNMAGLALVKGLEISISHVEWIGGLDYEFLAVVKPLFKGLGSLGIDGVLGIGIHYLHLPLFPKYDIWGTEVDKISYSDFAGVIGYAMEIKDFKLGFGLAFISENVNLKDKKIDKPSDFASSLSIGMIYTFKLRPFRLFGQPVINRTLNIGLSLENLSLAKIGGTFLPFIVKLGVSSDIFKNLIISMDLQFPISFSEGLDNYPRWNIGLEYWIFGMVAIRGGYRFFGYGVDTFSLGIGVKFPFGGKRIKFDFAYAPAGSLDHTSNFSLSMKFPGKVAGKDIKYANMLYYKGIYFYTNGKYEEAIKIWKEVLIIDPNNEKARKKIKDAKRLIELKKIEDKVKGK